MINKNNFILAPNLSGIYYLYSKRYKLVYIGKSNDIRKRLKQHYYNYIDTIKYIQNGYKGYLPQNYMYAKPFEYFRFTIIKNKEDLHFQELFMISEYNPVYNNLSHIFKTKSDKLNNNQIINLLISNL